MSELLQQMYKDYLLPTDLPILGVRQTAVDIAYLLDELSAGTTYLLEEYLDDLPVEYTMRNLRATSRLIYSRLYIDYRSAQIVLDLIKRRSLFREREATEDTVESDMRRLNFLATKVTGNAQDSKTDVILTLAKNLEWGALLLEYTMTLQRIHDFLSKKKKYSD